MTDATHSAGEGAMPDRFQFGQVARVPAEADNVAIATRRLDAGTLVADGAGAFRLPHTILEGHRFVRVPVAEGARLTSWGLPFGIAARALQPGEYVCNERILAALAERDIDFALPDAANFSDTIETYALDEATFSAGEQVAPAEQPATFAGFRRPGGRGVGTRNFVVVLATTSRANGFVREVAGRAAERAPAGIDGVVAVTHTEGGGSARPNNLDHVLRVLAGFIVHPNVGAVLAADDGTGAYANDDLRRFMEGRDDPLDHVPHAFFRIEGEHEREVVRAAALIEGWLPEVAASAARASPWARCGSRSSAAARTRSPGSPATRWRAGWRGRSSATEARPTWPRPTSSSAPSPTCWRTCATPARHGASSGRSRTSSATPPTTGPRPRATPPAATTSAASTTSR